MDPVVFKQGPKVIHDTWLELENDVTVMSLYQYIFL